MKKFLITYINSETLKQASTNYAIENLFLTKGTFYKALNV